MPDPVIAVEGLRKRYGDREVLRGIDLELAEGEVLGFLGANGAGKTTTIEILEGYRSRDDGTVRVLGVDPQRPTRAWRERLGLVLQSCELEPLLTVNETLRLFSSFYERPRPIDEVIALVGLGGKEDQRLGRLSGGQRRRADVAIALVGDPDLIFLDEPTTGFDPTARREAWTTITGLKELGKSVLLTTHYMEEAQHLADRVAVIRDGRIIADGKPGELSARAGARTTISFLLPAGVTAESVGATAEARADVAGNTVSVEVDDGQRALYRLTTWAEQEGLRLEDIEVHRPTLEDVFLELTREDADPEPEQPRA